MLINEKYLPNGDFDKIKARFVADGSKQSSFGKENNSPTISQASINLTLAISAFEGRHIMTVDVKAAFLNAKMPNKNVIIRIRRQDKIYPYLIKACPEYEKYTTATGILLELHGALYGLVESPRLWFNEISSTLINQLKLNQCLHDKCLFSSTNNDMIICLHVDDMLLSVKDITKAEEAINILTNKYGELKINKGNTIPYLGTIIENFMDKNEIHISQPALIDDLCNTPTDKTYVSPANTNIFEKSTDDNNNSINPVDEKQFVSKLMKILYAATKSRYDLLFPTAVLATKCSKPDTTDSIKLNRIYGYLKGTKHQKLIIKPRNTQLTLWADASHGVHLDKRSHTGIIVELGGAPILVESSKQKMNSHSSTESELISLNDGVKRLRFVKHLTDHLQIHQDVIKVMQDNLSTIELANSGNPNNKLSKHIDARHFAVYDQITNGLIKLEHICSEKMKADGLTKPITNKKKFIEWKEALMESKEFNKSNINTNKNILICDATDNESDKHQRGVLDNEKFPLRRKYNLRKKTVT